MQTYTTEEHLTVGAYFDQKKRLINDQLEEIFVDELKQYGTGKLVQAMEYTLMGDAKRLRPLLTIAVYSLFKQDNDAIIAPACAVELIHSSSLMLDDLPCMDNATVRRGRKASHLVFGESATILASAALLSCAYKILSEIEKIKINNIIGETADAIGNRGLIKGQFMDVESFNKARTIGELDECYFLKTSVLFYLSAKLGALLANANSEQVDAVGDIGKDLGLTFQIRDDILDAESTMQDIGKDVNIDAKNEKPTYVSILGVEEAKRRFSLQLMDLKARVSSLEKQNLQTNYLLNYIEILIGNQRTRTRSTGNFG